MATLCPHCENGTVYQQHEGVIGYDPVRCMDCCGTGVLPDLPSLAPLVKPDTSNPALWCDPCEAYLLPDELAAGTCNLCVSYGPPCEDCKERSTVKPCPSPECVERRAEKAEAKREYDAAKAKPKCDDEHCEHYDEAATDRCLRCEDEPMCESGSRECWPDDGHYCADCMGHMADRAMDMMDTER